MYWFQQLFFRRRRYDELSATIREHVDEKIDDLMDGGMTQEDAERAARREFGNVALVEQRSREVWQWPRLEGLWSDVRFSWKQLLRSPGISLITVLTIALGLAANAAIFTLTWNIVLASLPVPHPGQLVEYEMRNGETMMGLSGPQYNLLRQRQRTMTGLLAWASDTVLVRQATQTASTHVQFVSANAFHVLEMQPAIGRLFDEQQDAGDSANGIPAILSFDAWKSRFHGDENVIGQSLNVDNHAVTVIGVLPREFEGLSANFHPELYLPLSFENLEYGQDSLTHPGHFGLFVLGRLKPGFMRADAQTELDAIAPALRKDADPSGKYLNQLFKDFRLVVRDGRSGVSYVKAVYSRPLLVLELLVVFVLVLCCVNTALVMLARVSGRQHEFAVRSALGAGRVRLMRQVFAETMLLIIPGLVGGVFLGWLAAHLLVDMLGGRGTPGTMDLKPNPIILGINLAAALVVAVGAGLWPALRAGWAQPAQDLKTTAQRVASKRLGGWAISLQVAVSLALVSTAVLLSGTLSRLLTARSGFQPQGVVALSLNLRELKLSPAQETDLKDRLLEAVLTQPGIDAAGYIGLLPLSGFSGTASRMFSIDSENKIHSQTNLFRISTTSGYFAAAGTRILAGESAAAPPDAPPACVLSDSMARFFFPRQTAVGELVYESLWPQPDGTNLNVKNACRVAAVVEDARFVSLRQPAPAMLYTVERLDVANGDSSPFSNLLVRGRTTSLAADAVKRAATLVLPPDAIQKVQSLSDIVHQDLSRERILVSLSVVFAAIALLLTMLGLYGLLMRAVTLRTREIGIRLALGATAREILVAVGRTLLFQIVLGMAGGTALGFLLDGAVRRLLGLVASNSASQVLLGSAIVLLFALLALLVPARRAVTVNPMQALRTE
jgi:predicted permease